MRSIGIGTWAFPVWLRALRLLPLWAAPLLAAAFDFEDVAREAAASARQPYQAAPAADARAGRAELRRLPRHPLPPRALALARQRQPVPAAVLPAGPRHHRGRCSLYEVQDGQARPLEVPASDFQVGRVARGVQPLAGAAGWRLQLPAESCRPARTS